MTVEGSKSSSYSFIGWSREFFLLFESLFKITSRNIFPHILFLKSFRNHLLDLSWPSLSVNSTFGLLGRLPGTSQLLTILRRRYGSLLEKFIERHLCLQGGHHILQFSTRSVCWACHSHCSRHLGHDLIASCL